MPVRDHIDNLTRPRQPGPSPQMACTRPSCKWSWRNLVFADAGPCPRCGAMGGVRGTRLARLIRAARKVAA